jgi:transcriptional regulator with XRE-family HTH domain
MILIGCRRISIIAAMVPGMPSDPAITAAVGRAVRFLREQKGLSQEELAARCRMHRTYIGGIERGERNPTVSVLYRLADALQTSGSGLLNVSEDLRAT